MGMDVFVNDYLPQLNNCNIRSAAKVKMALSSSDGSLSMKLRHVSISRVRTSSSGNKLMIHHPYDQFFIILIWRIQYPSHADDKSRRTNFWLFFYQTQITIG